LRRGGVDPGPFVEVVVGFHGAAPRILSMRD
jgi:hypothetical protein